MESVGRLRTVVTALLVIYAVFILVWFILQRIMREPPVVIYGLNTFALYLFLPLPLVLIAALWLRRPLPWLAGGLVLAVFLFLFGGLLWPSSNRARAAGVTFEVLTNNTLHLNEDIDGFVETLSHSDADIIALQELTPLQAQALEEGLSDLYPHRELVATEDHRGMGILSRFPLRAYETSIPEDLNWLGLPQTYIAEIDGRQLLIVNFHVISPGLDSLAMIMRRADQRDRQVNALRDAIAAYDGPVVAVGDLNTVEFNPEYRVLDSVLDDAWRAVGWGWGHTFPGGPHRPEIRGMKVPPWLLRIDYIFYSEQLLPLEAGVGPEAGNADHRPVTASFALPES